MRWRGLRESQNVEDRRDEGGGFGFPFPGGGGMSFPSGGGGRGGGIGIIGILIILGLMLFFGIDPSAMMQGGGGDNLPNIQLPQSRPESANVPTPSTDQQSASIQHPQSTSEDDLKQFVSAVLATTEDSWQDLFRQYGQRYDDPQARALLGCRTFSVRLGSVGHGSVLLPR
jgi:predicted metalloprotease